MPIGVASSSHPPGCHTIRDYLHRKLSNDEYNVGDEDEAAKAWYVRIKSRPAFRSLLTDSLPGLQPPAHYADLDF